MPRARFADKRAQNAGFGAAVFVELCVTDSIGGTGVRLLSVFEMIFLALCLDLVNLFTIFIGWSPGLGLGGLVMTGVHGNSRGTKPDDVGKIVELGGALYLLSSISKLDEMEVKQNPKGMSIKS